MSTRSLLRAFSIVSKHRINMVNAELEPEIVLSESNRKACIERLQAYRFPVVHGKKVREAAVLVPLCLHKGELGFLYTLRSMKLTVNRGQVSFPGGKRDEEDSDLTETALRETWEELKIPREKIEVWSTISPIGKANVNVVPVLAYIGEVVPEELEVNRDEVEEAFFVSLQKLCDPGQFRYTYFNFKPHNLALPSYQGGKHRIWGFTGVITHVVLSSLLPQIYQNEYPYTPIQRSGMITPVTKVDKEGVVTVNNQSKL